MGENSSASILSEKHLRCVTLLAADKSVKQIAYDMGVTYFAVVSYIREAKRKLGVRKETGLVAIAIREGWI